MKNDYKKKPFAIKSRKAEMVITFLAVLMITAFISGNLAYAAPKRVDKEEVAAKNTLINFFSYLQSKQFDVAILLFAPTDYGMNSTSWEWLESFSPREERGDKSKVIENYCRSVNTCLNASVIDIRKISEGKYKLKVRFLKDDGTVFKLGACCGAIDDGPPTTSFIFYVEKVDGIYKVRTIPVYVP